MYDYCAGHLIVFLQLHQTGMYQSLNKQHYISDNLIICELTLFLYFNADT